MDSEILSIVLGGGGVVGVIVAIHAWYKDAKSNRVMREDTALSRLQEDYKRKEKEAEKAWKILAWFRYQYPMLWSAYMQMPNAEKERFPPTPPPEIDN